ncbi:MAG TPA: rifamycin-inactivating phosphotransferase [Trebonia sp.]
MIENYVLDLEDIDASKVALAGGKGAHLGELLRIGGVRVPAGFCVTTDAFRRIVAMAPVIEERLDRLSRLNLDDRDAICAISAEIRQDIEDVSVPGDLAAEITRHVAALGEQTACAVRSSATAEDLPNASFAGQQDTYLNVTGSAQIIRHVSRCLASLFSERAVLYRQRNGFDHRKVHMAVVVQEMVVPQASGVLFTADPVTSNRKVVSVEAVPGLGEALVSGLVNADLYKVRDGEIIDRKPQGEPVLTDARLERLARLGRRIEAHFGRPQDIEWCLADDEFQVVQSRPITTLFPVPEAGDDGNHVYVSVGHQQMMTDAMKPLGISMWQLTAAGPMSTAGGRLFVDVTRQLGSPAARARLVKALGTSDPLIGDALRSVIDRGDFIPELADSDAVKSLPRSVAASGAPVPIETDPAVVSGIIDRTQASLDALKRDIRGKRGQDLLDFIAADVQGLKKVMFTPQNLQVIMAGIEASGWLNEHLQEWLGEKNAADTLTQSAPGNVTAEMGLALLDVADVIRPYPGVVSFLERVTDAHFLDQLPALEGGRAARDAIDSFLDRYGMRGVGEIDITRPRWSERPDTLVPVLLGNVRTFGAGAGKQRFEHGRQEASKKEGELLTRLRTLPDGEHKAAETKRMIDRVRTFAGYREYPKYHMVSRYFVYKQALLAEADRLVTAGVLREREDIYYLTFGELGVVVRTGKADEDLIRERRNEFAAQAALTPPRVLTSDGEALTGSYRRGDVPAGALTGLPVSAGTVEGRARVVLDLSEAALGADDILVTAYTDPSWTPVFVAIKGLVTEVGGLMTHGAVIAREYGLPAVVGVEHATRLIRDGQRIRVHGTDGYVELLD